MNLYCANEDCIYYEMQRTNGRAEDGSCVRLNVQISESGRCEDKKLKYDGFKLCPKCEGAGYIKIPGVAGQERCYECDRLGYIKEGK